MEIEKYKKEGANLLMPTTNITQVSPWHQMSVTEVKVDPNPDNGEVFPVESKSIITDRGTEYVKQFCLSKVALMKIAQAAGIVWNHTECRPITVSKDYVLYSAVGAIRLPAGNWQIIPAKKEIDLTVIYDEILDRNLKTALKNNKSEKDKYKLEGMSPMEWAEMKTRSAMIQWRKHKLARAETGAMERVIRAALSMKQAYTLEELSKPFVVPRIDFSPDYSDPNVQRLLLQNGMQAMNNLFGANTLTALPDMNSPVNMITMAQDEPETFDTEFEVADEPDSAPLQEPEPEPERKPIEMKTAHCAACGVELTEKVAMYSAKKYRKPLCMTCQKEADKK